MEIRERDNNLLYGVSPRRLLSGYLPQNKDVDLCVVIVRKMQQISQPVILFGNIQFWYQVLLQKKSHLVSRILKLRECRRKKLKELSIDNRTGKERKTGCGKNCTPKPHVAPFDFSAQSSELFNCLTIFVNGIVDPKFKSDWRIVS